VDFYPKSVEGVGFSGREGDNGYSTDELPLYIQQHIMKDTKI